MRSFISRAALLVKVTARISPGRARPEARMWAMRVVSTRVLAGAGAGEHQDRTFGRLDRLTLFGIEAGEEFGRGGGEVRGRRCGRRCRPGL